MSEPQFPHPPDPNEPSQAEVEAVLSSFRAQSQQASSDMQSKRQRLPERDLSDIVRHVTVRLGGYTREGLPMPYGPDIELFKRTEAPFGEWVHRLQAAAADPMQESDEHGMKPGMREAIALFQENGGHVCSLDDEHIRLLMRNGAIAFIELQVREGVYVTLGTVSALSSVPWTDETGTDGKQRSPDDLDPQWPQYDLRDVKIPYPEQRKAFAAASRQILICRSSIHETLRSALFREELEGGQLPEHLEGRALRRLGLAARGKDEMFHIAQKFGSEDLTFNIGTVGLPKRKALNMGNRPSEAHNRWMNVWAWRHHYHTRLCDNINMYWTAYEGEIASGILAFEGPGGILSEKGWDIPAIHVSAQRNFEALQRDIASGRHAPWIPISEKQQ